MAMNNLGEPITRNPVTGFYGPIYVGDHHEIWCDPTTRKHVMRDETGRFGAPLAGGFTCDTWVGGCPAQDYLSELKTR